MPDIFGGRHIESQEKLKTIWSAIRQSLDRGQRRDQRLVFVAEQAEEV